MSKNLTYAIKISVVLSEPSKKKNNFQKNTHFIQFLNFFIFDFCERKKNRFPYSRTQIQTFFFTNLELRVYHTCLLNFISVAYVERIKISNCL